MTDERYLYLETRGRKTGQPRRIEIWFVEHEARHYIVSEQRGRSQWLQNLQQHAEVTFSVGTRAEPELELPQERARARVLDEQADAQLMAAVRARMDAKYAWSDGWIVELARDVRPDGSCLSA